MLLKRFCRHITVNAILDNPNAQNSGASITFLKLVLKINYRVQTELFLTNFVFQIISNVVISG